MASAFNWSPGGCCCGVVAGCFDVYGLVPTPNGESHSPHPGGLVRYGVMWPEIAQTPVGVDLTNTGYQSKERINWAIPPQSPLEFPDSQFSHATICGRPDLGDFVWSLERRTPPGGNPNNFVVLYDAVGKRELVAIETDSGSIIQPRTERMNFAAFQSTAASDSELFYIQDISSPPTRRLFNKDGTTKNLTWVPPISAVRVFEGGGYDGQPLPFGYHNDKAYIITYSPRDWPIASGGVVRTRYIQSGPNPYDYRVQHDVKMCYGEIEVNGDTFTWPESKRTIVHEYSTSMNLFSTSGSSETSFDNMRWRSFDSLNQGGTNCGAYAYYKEDDLLDPSSPVRAYVGLVVNGIVVKEFSMTAPFSSIYGVEVLNNYIWRCVPNAGGLFVPSHNGSVCLTLFDFAQEPSATNSETYVNPTKPYVVAIYKSSELWRSSAVASVRCRYASDRWFYLWSGNPDAGLPKSGWLPNEDYTMTSGADPSFWVVNEDGTHASPIGHLKYGESRIISGRNLTPLPQIQGSRGPYDCVKNPANIEGTLPADPAEFEDAVKSSTQ